MPMLETTDISCPHCGATFSALLEPEDAGSHYIQDCEICCQPIRFWIHADADGSVSAETEPEQ